MFSLLNSCSLCPRDCGVNRFEGGSGYCRSDAAYAVASICIHRGEEPVISGEHGICNIFFPHCNLQCIFCQNYQISRNYEVQGGRKSTLDEIIGNVKGFLESGCKSVGFVTPTHYLPHVHAIIDRLHAGDLYPVTVYNTNGYEKAEMLQSLEEKIDVYLPDFKYMDAETAGRYSGAYDYPDVAKHSLREMYRQKGSNVILSDTGLVQKGLIIRHLVLPGQVNESKRILRWIAEELSPWVHISLMAQYHPPEGIVCPPPLNRRLTSEEYESIIEEMESLGFCNGWIQELDSSLDYNPDFCRDHPFS
jgi:putative pyruvate formate lyase activating enzyme